MADDEVNLSESLAESAAGPKIVSVAGMGSSEEHNLKDQIAAARFLPTEAKRHRVGAGARFIQATPGGSA